MTLGGTSLTRGAKRHPTLEAGVIIGAGAKVLGGFTIGAGAKVGSNAVVVKAVPAGATAVGNPAHIVGTQSKHENEFSAYGVNVNDADPIVAALNSLLAHLEKTNSNQIALRERLATAGIDCGEAISAQARQETREEIEHIRDLLNR